MSAAQRSSNTHDETNVSVRGHEMTWEEVPGVLQSQVGQYIPPYKPEEIVARYREIYPDYTPDQVATAAATAFRAWPGQRWEAERRAQNPKSQPHTWVYQMNWKGIGGKAQHTIDIPFMFDNLTASPGQIGTSAEQIAAAQPLADAMSEMLIRYVKTSDPNGGTLPHWPAHQCLQSARRLSRIASCHKWPGRRTRCRRGCLCIGIYPF